MKKIVIIVVVLLIAVAGCNKECEPSDLNDSKSGKVWVGDIFSYITYRYKERGINTSEELVIGAFQCPRCKEKMRFSYTAGVGGVSYQIADADEETRILCCNYCRYLLTTNWKLIDYYDFEYDEEERIAQKIDEYRKQGYRFEKGDL